MQYSGINIEFIMKMIMKFTLLLIQVNVFCFSVKRFVRILLLTAFLLSPIPGFTADGKGTQMFSKERFIDNGLVLPLEANGIRWIIRDKAIFEDSVLQLRVITADGAENKYVIEEDDLIKGLSDGTSNEEEKDLIQTTINFQSGIIPSNTVGLYIELNLRQNLWLQGLSLYSQAFLPSGYYSSTARITDSSVFSGGVLNAKAIQWDTYWPVVFTQVAKFGKRNSMAACLARMKFNDAYRYFQNGNTQQMRLYYVDPVYADITQQEMLQKFKDGLENDNVHLVEDDNITGYLKHVICVKGRVEDLDQLFMVYDTQGNPQFCLYGNKDLKERPNSSENESSDLIDRN